MLDAAAVVGESFDAGLVAATEPNRWLLDLHSGSGWDVLIRAELAQGELDAAGRACEHAASRADHPPHNASAASTVEVHIAHTFIGDLIVTLVAPDGSTYRLHNRTGGNIADINQTYTVNLASEPSNGTWRLRVQDAAPGDIGRIDSWTLSL